MLLTVYLVVWTAITAVIYWVWVIVLDAPRPHDALFPVLDAIGALLSTVFDDYVRPLPFRGKAPEEVAAEAFLAGQDVRSDDHQFEADLKD